MLVTLTETRDRGVIGPLIGRDHAVGDILQTLGRVGRMRAGLQELVDRFEICLPEYVTDSYGVSAGVPAAGDDREGAPSR